MMTDKGPQSVARDAAQVAALKLDCPREAVARAAGVSAGEVAIVRRWTPAAAGEEALVAVMYFVGFEADLVEVGGDIAAQAVVLVEQTPAKAGAVAAGVIKAHGGTRWSVAMSAGKACGQAATEGSELWLAGGNTVTLVWPLQHVYIYRDVDISCRCGLGGVETPDVVFRFRQGSSKSLWPWWSRDTRCGVLISPG
jgi:hypothetical protein